MRVFAVIVCYRPDVEALRRLCDRLIECGAAAILVDNSEERYVLGSGWFADCDVISNGENLGIARAQNLGIARAISAGASAVVFFDQDSQIEVDFLPALLSPCRAGTPLVVAPVSRDAVGEFEYRPTRVSRFGWQTKVAADGRTEPYQVDIVLSSGTAATVEVFERVGMMDEALFIDSVDTEWCLRCRREGVPILVVPFAVMRHSIGSGTLDLGFITPLVHGPVRSYYQVRNCLLLFRRDSVPFLFSLQEALLLIAHKALLLTGVDDRMAYLKAYLHGVRDGLLGVTGKRPS